MLIFNKTKLANSKNGGGGQLLNKNAFTLIELLAIIVILAIIAVITVPIILNIIENSRMGAAKDSAYGYKDSIDKWYVSKLSENPNYNIPDGEHKIGELGEQIEGKKPESNSWFKTSQNKITDGCLQFDEYKVELTNGKISEAQKGQCGSAETASLTGEVLENIQSYFSNDIDRVVYYNPIDGKTCTDYDSSNSTPGYKGTNPQGNQTACLKWYKYSTNKDGSINMILDYNTEVGVDYSTVRDEIDTAYSVIKYGPNNLMQYLTLTEWAGVPTRNDKYTAYKDENGTKTTLFTEAEDNTVNYTGKKARLITAQEIADIVGYTGWNEKSKGYDGSFYLDSKSNAWNTKRTADNPSDYYWLFENLKNCAQYGCINQSDTANWNYYTRSPQYDIWTTTDVWIVNKTGSLEDLTLISEENGGPAALRPVITIK